MCVSCLLLLSRSSVLSIKGFSWNNNFDLILKKQYRETRHLSHSKQFNLVITSFVFNRRFFQGTFHAKVFFFWHGSKTNFITWTKKIFELQTLDCISNYCCICPFIFKVTKKSSLSPQILTWTCPIFKRNII